MNNQNLNDAASKILDPFSRRGFLKMSGGCAALTSTALLSQLLNMQLTQSAAANDSGNDDDYKALVCVFLLGGIDSFNMVTPYDQTEYDEYSLTRGGTDSANGGLAIDRGELRPINAGGGRQLGLHPGIGGGVAGGYADGVDGGLEKLYNDGNAAIISNVGSLVVPTTKTNYGSVQRPLGLFSHADLVRHWQTSVPETRSSVTGWGGRMADLLDSANNPDSTISMNIALGSLNVFQTGDAVVPYVVNKGSLNADGTPNSNGGATTLFGYGNNNNQDKIYRRLTNHMYPSDGDTELSGIYGDLLQRTLAKSKRISVDAAQAFNDATSDEPVTMFPNSNLSLQLKKVAQTIAARDTICQKRQVFFVTAGGWDHHANLINNQAAMLPDISQAIKAFYDETVALGVQDKVTTFTASDFARTLNSNGSGSDHGWGGNHFVVGGAVDGGKVYGDYPTSLLPGNDLDLGRGRLIPTMSVDEYNAELALWFGVGNNSDLETILPNVRNFFGSGGGSAPVGFMG